MKIHAAEADAALRHAVVRAMRDGATTAGAIVRATRDTGASISERRHALLSVLAEGRGFVRVSLSMITAGTSVHALDLRGGRGTTADFRAALGPGSSRNLADGAIEETWTLSEIGGPSVVARIPYPLQEAANPARPTCCAVPFSPLEPSEALKLCAIFDANGMISARLYAT